MSTPRAAVIQDLSGFGRCSMTLALPALSAMGVQCCPVLTAYLSSHTGGLGDNTFCDLTDQMAPVAAHWQSLNLAFDAILTGFMGSYRQIRLTRDFLAAFRRPGCPAVVDPVMGDGGRLYRTYTPQMRAAMAELAGDADVITPNPTEAAALLDADYGSLALDREEACRDWAKRLSLDGRRSVVLKGISLRPGETGAACFDRTTGQTELISASQAPGRFHGTGDLFAAVLTGALAKGMSLAQGTRRAADFVSLCAWRTAGLDTPRREGLDFEPLLWRLGTENGDRT